MGKGKKQHLKRLNAPKSWRLSKMGGIFAPNPTRGPYNARDCLPLLVLIRNFLRYAKSATEAKIIIQRGHILVNGKPRTCPRYPVGLMDVVFIPLLSRVCRLIYNADGRWVLVTQKYKKKTFEKDLPCDLVQNVVLNEKPAEVAQKVEGDEKAMFGSDLEEQKSPEKKPLRPVEKTSKKNTGKESSKSKKNANSSKAKRTEKPKSKEIGEKIENGIVLKNTQYFYKPCRVKQKKIGHKQVAGYNKAAADVKDAEIPWLTTECGRMVKYVDRKIQPGDTVIVRIESSRLEGYSTKGIQDYLVDEEVHLHLPFEEGKTGIVVRGKNVGRVGKIKFIEKHIKINDVVYFEDERGNKFVTKKENVMIIGNEHSEIGLSKDRGVRMSLEQKAKWCLINN